MYFRAIFVSCLILSTLQAENQWDLPAVDISTITQNSSSAHVVVDPSGNAVAIWITDNGPNVIVQSATLLFGSPAWSSPITASTLGEDADGPTLGIDASGNVVGLWRGGSEIVSATLPLGGSWTTPENVSAGAASEALQQIAVDPNGNAVAIWRQSSAGNTVISAAFFPVGGPWESPTQLSAGGQDATEPQIVIDSNGNAIAIWERNSNVGDEIIQSATLPFGGSWSSVTDISATGIDSHHPQIGVDSAGNAVAIWNTQAGVVQAATLPFGGSWSAPTDVFAAGDGEAPEIAVNSAGDAVALWQLFGITDVTLQSATLPFGGAWSVAIDVPVLPGSTTVQSQKIGIDADGNAVAVWEQFNGSTSNVQASTLPFGGVWATPTVLSASAVSTFVPDVAVTPSEYAVAVWHVTEGFFIIQATTFGSEPPSPVLPATNVGGHQVSNNFGVQSELFNTFHWSASASTNIASYRIYRSGQLITTLPATKTEYTDHNRKKGVTYTYEIVAVDTDGNTSAAATISLP